MQKNSTRFFIYSILIMTVLVVVASFLISNFTNQFQHSESTNIVNAATTSDFSAGSATSANADGAVAEHGIDGTAVYCWGTDTGLANVGSNPSHTPSGTAVTQSNYASCFATGTISTSYYLTEDIDFTLQRMHSSYWRGDSDSTYTGVFDGCGHTIRIKSGAFSGTSNYSHNGILWARLQGTLKNVTIIVENFSYPAITPKP